MQWSLMADRRFKMLFGRYRAVVVWSLLCGLFAVCAAAQKANVPTLLYDEQTRGPVPIPPSERNLQTVVAEFWFKVSDQTMVLEGPCFDRNGSLVFSDVNDGRVLRLTPDQHLSVIFTKNKLGPGGLAIHKDRRIFIAGVGDLRGPGSIVAINPDGSNMQTIVPQEAGYLPNDLVFDADGGFRLVPISRLLFTDAAGGRQQIAQTVESHQACDRGEQCTAEFRPF
jgi:lactonase